MPGVFVGSTELTAVGDIKIGGTDVQEVYVGATLVFPTAVGFQPSDLPNLEFWFDASDAGTITEVGGEVSQWDDKSVNGIDVSQLTASLQPNTSSVDGQESLFFDGVDVLTATGLSIPISPCSLFMVITTTTTGGDDRVLTMDVSGFPASLGTIRLNGAAGNIRSDQSTSDGSTSSATILSSMTVNDPIGYVSRAQTGVTTEFEDSNGLSGIDASVGTLRTPAISLFVGGRDVTSSTEGWTGHLHELGLYSALITNEERDNLLDYLVTKWGL